MMISTKGRYALRVMIDLAQNNTGEFISLKDVAKRQNISMKYLEMIVSLLNKGKMVESQRGKSGGYRLARKPSEYTIESILTLTEGTLAPVNCLETGAKNCERAANCITLPLWKKLDKVIGEYLESVTLEDLIESNV
ncbi:MAG: RrF2 family transcriptional regulator [Eubacterium sp.]